MMNLTTELINEFIESQLSQWELADTNFRNLRNARRANLDLFDLKGAKQLNPARIVSSDARIDPESLKKRECFLCSAKRPAQQITVPWVAGWQLLVNPFPILPVHFTIVNPGHVPQSEIPLELASMAEAAPDLAIFYNGARAGASAPDHQHAQAVLKSELPLVRLVEKYHSSDKAGWISSEEYGLRLPFHFLSAVITPDVAGMKALALCPGAFGVDENGNHDTGLVNAFFWIGVDGLLRIVIVPRRRHRPACYFKEEDNGRLVISPGAIDMSGLMIIPREKDYERADAGIINAIYGEVAYADGLPLPVKNYFKV